VGLVREVPTPYGSSYGAVYFELILETALVLVLGTGEGAVLTGTLAYGLCDPRWTVVR